VVGPLTRDFGFRYAATPAGFDHVLQVTLVDAQGRIARQVYGDKPAADEIGEPLKQMLSGAPLPPQTKLADLIDRVRLLCTVYDPKTGSYRVDYSLAIEIAGGLTFILAMALYMLNEWLERRTARRKGAPREPLDALDRPSPALWRVRRLHRRFLELARVSGAAAEPGPGQGELHPPRPARRRLPAVHGRRVG